MSKSLILDWQKNSLMLARATGRSSKTAIDAVSIKPIGTTDSVSQTASEALRGAAQELGAKGEVSVLVARELVELRTVQIPKMDADELPDVIRFQAQRQFANMTDAWTVDFVMLPAAAGNDMQTALVAAISPAQIAEIESACSSAGLQAVTIGLRPLQIVHMAIESGLVSGSGRSMIVSVSEFVADLLILREGKILQVRSTKLPYEADQVASALHGEVRRSLVAAASELEGKSIDSILLIASAGRSESLLAALRRSDPTANIVAFHPETLLTTADSALADSAGNRLVAVAGAMGLKTADRSTVVDFKNPKRRPPKKRDSRKLLLIGGAAATLFVAAVGWYYSTITSLDNDYALIKEELDAKKESGETARKRLAEFAAIEKFAADAPNWLDELVQISQKIPGSDKIMLSNPNFSIGRNGVGVIDVALKATDTDSITKFGSSLSNDNYKVSPGTTQELPKAEGRYKYRGDVTIEVSGRGWDLNAPARSSSEETATASKTQPEDKAADEPVATPAVSEPPKSEEPSPNEAEPSGTAKTTEAAPAVEAKSEDPSPADEKPDLTPAETKAESTPTDPKRP
jgi:hypothetical protein